MRSRQGRASHARHKACRSSLYVPLQVGIVFTSSCKPLSQPSTPCASICSNVTPSTPGAPGCRFAISCRKAGKTEIAVPPSPCNTAFVVASGSLPVCSDSRQSPHLFYLQHSRSWGPLLGRHYPASSLLQPHPSPVAARTLQVSLGLLSPQLRASRICTIDYRNMPSPLPRRIKPGRSLCLPRLARPSPFRWRVGIHISPFEACSSFTHVGPAASLNRPWRPLSRGFGLHSYRCTPLVS